jgi:DNA-binding NarL/FixJ family response regulator
VRYCSVRPVAICDCFDLPGEKRVSVPIKVFIVDNDDAFRQKTRASLESAEGIVVVGEARDGQKATPLIRETCPDIILLDIASNLERLAQICTLSPNTKIVALHDAEQEHLVLNAFKKGALGHLIRSETQPAGIVAAIRAVSRGEAVISSGVAGRILDQVVQERKVFERR